MRMVDVIDKKRNGGELSDEEIKFFVDGVVSGEIPDYQTSALLMSIYFKDMNDHERSQLTLDMMNSGTGLTFPASRASRSTSTPPAASATR